MDFRAAFSNMKKGIPMKRKKWNDVWYYDKSKKILMGKHDSGKLEELFNIPDTANMTYIFMGMFAEDWEIANNPNESQTANGKQLFTFSKALDLLKQGYKVARMCWYGSGRFVLYRKGLPAGHPCDIGTVDAYLEVDNGEGLINCDPYLQMRYIDGSLAMYLPSVEDLLAEDWYIE